MMRLKCVIIAILLRLDDMLIRIILIVGMHASLPALSAGRHDLAWQLPKLKRPGPLYIVGLLIS